MDNGEDETGRTDPQLKQCEDNKDGNVLNYKLNAKNEANGEYDERDALGKPGAYNGEVYTRMPVSKYSPAYNMKHPKRGLAVIFNHEIFDCGGLKPRSGTNEDCKNLKDCLTKLGFEILVFKDLSYKELEMQAKTVSEMDHSNHDCVVFTILSHGEMNVIYAKDTPYKPEGIFSLFTADKCPTLAGKPKIFFVQACQGDKLDQGVHLVTTETDGETHNTYKIPVQADFLIVYSTVRGYYSWRNTTNGSWFIQALCMELKERAPNNDLLTILTFVSQRVALDFESNVPGSATMHRQKQIPCVMSMLTRLVYFTPPGYEEGPN